MCCVPFCFSLMGCGAAATDEKAALRGRAEAFGDLLARIQDMPESEAKEALEEFIEPSPTQAGRIAKYYREFSATSKKFKIVSQSVTNIKINSDGVNAEVTYRTVAQSPGGTKIPAEQVTQWKQVDNEWYRTVGEPQRRYDP